MNMISGIYEFQGKDITMNMVIQIKAVVDELQKRLNISFEEAMLLFLSIRNLYNTAADGKCFVGGICRVYYRQGVGRKDGIPLVRPRSSLLKNIRLCE